MAGDRGRTRTANNRSRISNGRRLLPSVHEQSVWARLVRDKLDAVIAHCGGDGYVSELERMQARRIAVLEAELIYIENRIGLARAAGQEPTPQEHELYVRLANGQRRHGECLGWRPHQKDVTPSIDTYLATQGLKRGETPRTPGPTGAASRECVEGPTRPPHEIT